jgi:hypothetical protein
MNQTCNASLDALAMVSQDQRAAALAHPRWASIASSASAARQLAWMVSENLLSYDELDELQTFGEQASEQDRIVEQAYAMLSEPPPPHGALQQA